MMADGKLVLYDYWRSSAAYRVRIALHLKGLDFLQRPVHLVRDGGEQHKDAYRVINPQGLVPALVHDGRVLVQSMAICEYLEERFPRPALLPASAEARARARALALTIACDMHPLNNLRVQKWLRASFGADDERVVGWMNHWMAEGFAAIERHLQHDAPDTGFCGGDRAGLADCFLVPQVYNAERFGCDLEAFPRIREVVRRCRSLPAFIAASPESQPDAPAR